MAKQRPLQARASRTVLKIAPAISAAFLALAFVTPVAAGVSSKLIVPCSGPRGGASGLIAAINAANAIGHGTIDLVQGCTYTLGVANNTKRS